MMLRARALPVPRLLRLAGQWVCSYSVKNVESETGADRLVQDFQAEAEAVGVVVVVGVEC